MRWLLSLGLLTAAGCGAFTDRDHDDPATAPVKAAATSDALSAVEAERLIPAAAAIPVETLERFVTDPPETVSGIEDQRLTALVLAMDPLSAAREDASVLGDFRYVFINPPVPEEMLPSLRSRILQAVRTGDGMATIIQREYIIDCTCRSQGDRAEGVVLFRAPNVYEGQAEFTAERIGENWQVTEFRMPAYRLTTRRTSDGTWQLAGEPLLAGMPSH